LKKKKDKITQTQNRMAKNLSPPPPPNIKKKDLGKIAFNNMISKLDTPNASKNGENTSPNTSSHDIIVKG
jgi:hypothetical protein